MASRAIVYARRDPRSVPNGGHDHMSLSDIVWRPDPAAAARTRIGRFMRRHDLPTVEALQRRSVEDLEWYWNEVSRDLGWRWSTPYDKVADLSRGIQWPRWFPGGRMNLSENCVDKHLARRGAEPAVISEAENGESRTLTYAALAEEVGQLANALKRLGIKAGDTVGVFLPMSQEAAVAILACSRIGAIYAPCFSGFGAQAVATRLQSCDARVLITADGFSRRGNTIPMKQTADEAVRECPTIRHVIVHRRLGAAVPSTSGRDLWWHEVVAAESAVSEALQVEADHPALI